MNAAPTLSQGTAYIQPRNQLICIQLRQSVALSPHAHCAQGNPASLHAVLCICPLTPAYSRCRCIHLENVQASLPGRRASEGEDSAK